MAKLMNMTQSQFEWAFHDALATAGLAMEARLTTAIFAEAIAGPGPARSRVADFLGVFKEPPKRSAPPTGRTADAIANKSVSQQPKKLRGSHFGGPAPRPGPDGTISITMMLGDSETQARWDASAQRQARKYELINELRAGRPQGGR